MISLAWEQPDVSTEPIATVIQELRSMALRGLKRMYRPEHGLFAFTLRRTLEGWVLEGESRRYTAIGIIGLSRVEERARVDACGGEDVRNLCQRLVASVNEDENLGDVALTLWAAIEIGEVDAGPARDRLLALRPWEELYPTVEMAWALTALSSCRSADNEVEEAATRIADRLVAWFQGESGMFPHGPAGRRGWRLRSHITCFADLVYPIQALSHFYLWKGRESDIVAARRCAERMCELQGPAGQWWWHYDVRTGEVVERYPVYAVHQHAMGPMALAALRRACGTDHSSTAERGLQWLIKPPEMDGSLIDREAGIIWRKVARHEPRKLVRTVQSAATRLHSRLRVPGLGAIFPPGRVDYECRPYELGWLLYTWSRNGATS